MFGRVFILGTVAAADMAASKAHPQVDPRIPRLDAILTDRDILRMDFPDLIFVRTGFLWHSV
jgi:hypothetical protein